MDVLAAVGGFTNAASIAQAIVGTGIVTGIVCCEIPGRVVGLNARQVSLRSYAKGIGKVVVCCLPEVLAVGTVLCMAVLLRLRGDDGLTITGPGQLEEWARIKVEWPVLMGADTLLNLQVMFRLLVVLFFAVRADKTGASPLSGMASVFFLGSMLARGWLSTQSLEYRLEGPLSLGGDMGVFCEAAMVPFLAAIALKALRRFPVAVIAVGLATAYSRCHFFNLAHTKDIDSAFTLAHLLELFASFAFLLRTIGAYCSGQIAKGSASIGFLHLLMPAQQALAAYYWLTAYTPQNQLPVGAGKPWCLLIMTNLLQFAAFLCSAALYFGGSCGQSMSEQEDAPTIEDLDQAEHDGLRQLGTTATAAAPPRFLGPVTTSL